MGAEQKQYRAVAATWLNSYPGTMIDTPPDFRIRTTSEPMSMDEARAKVAEWASVVESPGWEFTIEPAD